MICPAIPHLLGSPGLWQRLYHQPWSMGASSPELCTSRSLLDLVMEQSLGPSAEQTRRMGFPHCYKPAFLCLGSLPSWSAGAVLAFLPHPLFFFSSCLPGTIWASSFSWGNAKVLNHRKILTNGEVVHRQSHVISLYPPFWTHSIHTLLALAGTCETNCAAPPASNPLGRLHCNLALGDGVGSCWLDLPV